MANATDDRVDAYAEALLGVARAEGSLEVIEDELFKVARAIEASDELRGTLTDDALPIEVRQGVVEELLGGKASQMTTSLVSFLVGAGRARDLPAIIDRLVRRTAEERSEEIAEVRTAMPLDDDQKTRLEEALGKATGKKISVKVIIDPSILGGVVARIGDNVIDGSVRHRLTQLRAAL